MIFSVFFFCNEKTAYNKIILFKIHPLIDYKLKVTNLTFNNKVSCPKWFV